MNFSRGLELGEEKSEICTEAQHNKRLQRTGISGPLIDNVSLAQLIPGR
jgi:hypothetical protein